MSPCQNSRSNKLAEALCPLGKTHKVPTLAGNTSPPDCLEKCPRARDLGLAVTLSQMLNIASGILLPCRPCECGGTHTVP